MTTPPLPELDLDSTGIVIVDHGSRRAASNQMLEAFVEQFAPDSGYRIVEPAHMELAEPSIASAFDRCVQRGARRVAVVPYFLSPGKHWFQDIPNITRDAALKHPGVEYVVTAPIGLNPMMKDVIATSVGYCLDQIQGKVVECASCAGTGRCKLRTAEQADVVPPMAGSNPHHHHTP
ncbi:MAG: CbiX/SirB N-terminal domain-containing protein [Planctomycetota bacterium]